MVEMKDGVTCNGGGRGVPHIVVDDGDGVVCGGGGREWGRMMVNLECKITFWNALLFLFFEIINLEGKKNSRKSARSNTLDVISN